MPFLNNLNQKFFPQYFYLVSALNFIFSKINYFFLQYFFIFISWLLFSSPIFSLYFTNELLWCQNLLFSSDPHQIIQCRIHIFFYLLITLINSVVIFINLKRLFKKTILRLRTVLRICWKEDKWLRKVKIVKNIKKLVFLKDSHLMSGVMWNGAEKRQDLKKIIFRTNLRWYFPIFW